MFSLKCPYVTIYYHQSRKGKVMLLSAQKGQNNLEILNGKGIPFYDPRLEAYIICKVFWRALNGYLVERCIFTS
jgi:hypothetical protein